jgi:FixJ family two-component response regulator
LILDLHMPGLTGLELQMQIARLGLRIPIVVITAYDESETREKCLLAGAAAFLQKPLDGQVLLDAVAAAVGDRSDSENRKHRNSVKEW